MPASRRRAHDGKYYTTERIGRTQALTPEGFLLCKDVPIARTGVMLYADGEVPVDADKDGLARVERNPEEVFAPATIASFEGKPVTDDHPDEGVNPDNWKQLAVGTVQNVRRGEGILDDLLLADLLITDKDAIEAVRDGKREVSCGYDADYEQVAPGRGSQHNILGNHVALVERGRCGPRCAIGDQAMATKSGVKRPSFKDRLLAAFKARDEEAVKEVMDEMEEAQEGGSTEHHVHVHINGQQPEGGEAKGGEAKDDGEEVEKEEESKDADPSDFGARLDKIEALLTKLVPQEEAEGHEGLEGSGFDEKAEEGEQVGDEEAEEKEKSKTGDSAIRAMVKDTAARCEILAPGFKMPTFDAKADPKKVRDTLCGCKRRALDAALKSHPGVVKPILGSQTIAKATCDTIDMVFTATSEVVRQLNNAQATHRMTADKRGAPATADTAADLNKRFRDFWSPNAK